MTLPGFNAETSLYKTSAHYRLMGASMQADGVVPQQALCGWCHWDVTGSCLRNCRICYAVFPGGIVHCYSFIEPCNPSVCPSCTDLKNMCIAEGGTPFDCSGLVGGCNACPPCCFKCF